MQIMKAFITLFSPSSLYFLSKNLIHGTKSESRKSLELLTYLELFLCIVSLMKWRENNLWLCAVYCL
jgi:hypothetical protein